MTQLAIRNEAVESPEPHPSPKERSGWGLWWRRVAAIGPFTLAGAGLLVVAVNHDQAPLSPEAAGGGAAPIEQGNVNPEGLNLCNEFSLKDMTEAMGLTALPTDMPCNVTRSHNGEVGARYTFTGDRVAYFKYIEVAVGPDVQSDGTKRFDQEAARYPDGSQTVQGHASHFNPEETTTYTAVDINNVDYNLRVSTPLRDALPDATNPELAGPIQDAQAGATQYALTQLAIG